MLTEELIGKTITNIYTIVEMEVGGMDKGECFIELDHHLVIDIPFSGDSDVWIKELKPEARSLFEDLSDYPVYQMNPDIGSIMELVEKRKQAEKKLINRIRKFLFGYEVKLEDYIPHKVEYRENKLKHVKGKKIADLIWFPDDMDKGFLLLENGYLITETSIAFHGTGLAGLNLFESVNELVTRKGEYYSKLSDSL